MEVETNPRAPNWLDCPIHRTHVRRVLYEDGGVAGWRAECSCGWGSDWTKLYRREHLAHEAANAHSLARQGENG